MELAKNKKMTNKNLLTFLYFHFNQVFINLNCIVELTRAWQAAKKLKLNTKKK